MYIFIFVFLQANLYLYFITGLNIQQEVHHNNTFKKICNAFQTNNMTKYCVFSFSLLFAIIMIMHIELGKCSSGKMLPETLDNWLYLQKSY